jgi:hypothetical protein
MSSDNARERLQSNGQTSAVKRYSRTIPIEPERSARLTCPECTGRVITTDLMSFCTDFGLIAAE